MEKTKLPSPIQEVIDLFEAAVRADALKGSTDPDSRQEIEADMNRARNVLQVTLSPYFHAITSMEFPKFDFPEFPPTPTFEDMGQYFGKITNEIVRDPKQFRQICAAQDGTSPAALFALDGHGHVWQYAERDSKWYPMGTKRDDG